MEFNSQKVHVHSHIFLIIVVLLVIIASVISSVLTVEMMSSKQARINVPPRAAESRGKQSSASNPLLFVTEELGKQILLLDATESDFDTLGDGSDSRPQLDLGTTQEYKAKRR